MLNAFERGNLTRRRRFINSGIELIHVTKAAGGAIEEWGVRHGFKWGSFHPVLRYPKWLQVKYGRRGGMMERWHTPPGLLLYGDQRGLGKAAASLSVDPYARAHTFCVVRHPVCRMVSEFRCPFQGSRGNMNFSLWVRKRVRQQLGPLPISAHGLPIMPWYPCMTYLRFERLQSDFASFVEAVILPRRPSAKHWNLTLPRVNGALPLKYNVTPQDLALILRTFRDDFERFNYSASNPPCRMSQPLGFSNVPYPM